MHKLALQKKQYQKLDDTFAFDKIIEKNPPEFKKHNISNIICNNKHSFYEYYNNKNFNSLSLMSKYPILLSFYSDLIKFHNLNPQKQSRKERKTNVDDNASELYKEYLEIQFGDYKTLSDAKKVLGNKYNSINLFFESYNYEIWFENEESTVITSRKSDKEESIDVSDMSPLEGDEEVKREQLEDNYLQGFKLLNYKLLTRLPMLLAKIEAGNNSKKIKNEIRKTLYLLHQHNYNNLIKSL